MNGKSSRAVSPVIAVILMVAVTVVLSAAIGAFVFDLGQSSTGGQAQQKLGVSTSQSNGTYTAQVVTGEADKLKLLVNGQTEANLTNPTPGDTISTIVGREDEVAVLVVTDGDASIVQTDSSTTSPTAPTVGLASRYSMESGSGTTAVDVVGNQDGTIYNSTWTTGKVGNSALDFDGDYDYINLPDRRMDGSRTVTLWHKPRFAQDDGNTYFMFSSIDEGVWDNSVLLYKYKNDGYVGGYEESGSANYPTAPDFDRGEWNFITISINNSTGEAFVYEDGQMGQSVSISGTFADTLLTTRIGAHTNAGGVAHFYKGKIDDVRIYNRALSQTELERLYDATK